MKHILLITFLFFINMSLSSCNNNNEESIISEYKTPAHERIHALTGDQRLELIMNAYRSLNQLENRGEAVTEIRANRYNVAHHYPQTGKDVYEEGLKNWCANYPDEVADYIIYINSFTNKK